MSTGMFISSKVEQDPSKVDQVVEQQFRDASRVKVMCSSHEKAT